MAKLSNSRGIGHVLSTAVSVEEAIEKLLIAQLSKKNSKNCADSANILTQIVFRDSRPIIAEGVVKIPDSQAQPNEFRGAAKGRG